MIKLKSKALFLIAFIGIILSLTCSVYASNNLLDVTKSDIDNLEKIINEKYFSFTNSYDYADCSDEEFVRYLMISLFCNNEISQSDNKDPLNKLQWNYKVDGEYLDWISQNIFHKKISHNYNSDFGYYYNGYYYYMIEGIGGMDETYSIVSCEKRADNKYNIKGILDFHENGEQYNFYIIADLQELNGKREWTFYKSSKLPLFYDEESANDIRLQIDGEDIIFPIDSVKPQIYNNRVYVPIRKACEYLGITVKYDSSSGMMYFYSGNGRNSSHLKGTSIIYVNGNPVNFDTTSINVNGNTLMPIRMLAESLGKSVSWNSDTRTVNVIS